MENENLKMQPANPGLCGKWQLNSVHCTRISNYTKLVLVMGHGCH